MRRRRRRRRGHIHLLPLWYISINSNTHNSGVLEFTLKHQRFLTCSHRERTN